MPHWRTYFPSEYLEAADFENPKATKTGTIKAVQIEEVTAPSGKKAQKPVLYFEEAIKPLIVNATIGDAVSIVAGKHYTEEWIGTKIEIYVDPNAKNYGGGTKPRPRVKKYPPRPRKPALDSSHPAYEKVAAAVADGYTRAQIEQKYTVSDAVWADLQDYNQEES